MREYANNIITKGGISVDATHRAQLYLGKSAFSEGDFDKAIDQLLNTVNLAKDAYGAEAQYLLGRIFYQQEQYQQTLNTLFEFNENFSDHDEWLGKAFLLIVDTYVALNELFQAKATAMSITEYSPIEEIVEQAKEKLAAIEKMEAELPVEEEAVIDTTQNKGRNK